MIRDVKIILLTLMVAFLYKAMTPQDVRTIKAWSKRAYAEVLK
jgi:hypothetical protein